MKWPIFFWIMAGIIIITGLVVPYARGQEQRQVPLSEIRFALPPMWADESPDYTTWWLDCNHRKDFEKHVTDAGLMVAANGIDELGYICAVLTFNPGPQNPYGAR